MEQYIKESPLNYQKTNGITNKIKDNIVYGDILTDKHIGSVYNMTESFFQPQAESGIRFIENIKSQWYANERNSLFRDYINETDEERKKEILEEIKDIEYNLRTYVGTGDWVDKVSQTAISFGYSMAPALAVGAVATAGVATAGAPLAIAGAVGTTAQALTSYINAFRPERNAIVYETALENPELSKEDIEKRATTGASISAGIEAVGSVFGVAGGIKNFLTKKTASQLAKEIVKQTTKKSLASKALRFGFEAGVEGATEAIQESITEKAKETADVKEIALGSVKEIAGILEKQAKGLALNEKEEQLIETFVLSTIGSAIVGGGFQSSYTGVEKVWQYQQNKRLQNNFETLRKNIPTDVPEKAQQYVAKEMVNYGKAPENVYMPAEKTLAIVEEQLNKDTLTDVERGRLDALKEKLIQTADKGTGVEQLSFLEVFDTFVNQSDEEFFQKAKSLFFAEESMVDENFSAENLVMQAVKDIMPEAVEADSAFNFAFESLKNANPETIEQETIANALQFQALMNVASTSQGKTFKDIMQENNIVFDIQKKLLSKNEIAGVPYKQETIEDLDTLVYEQGDLFDNLSQIVIDENNKVLSGVTAVEKAKKEKAFVEVFRIKAKDFPKIQVQAQEKIAGSVKNTANSIILKMTQTANPTTFAHESFHLFDVLMADAYKNNRLNDYWKKQYERMYKAVGVKDLFLADSDKKERLAEAWTEYLATGKEPAQRLFAMFAYFKSMLGTIYHSLVRRNALNKDLRKVYDRIFLSQSEAELAMKALRIGAMKKPANISDEDYAKYIAAAKKTTARISDSINKAIIERTEIENSEEYKTQRDSVRADVVKELSDVELFKAQDFILDKKGIQGEFAGIEINPAFEPKNKKSLTVEEMAIELTGYLNRQVDASEVMGIISERTRQETIEQETDLRMQEWLRENNPALFERMNAFNNALSLKAIDAVTWEYIFASGLKGKSFGEVKALLFKGFSDTVKKESIKKLYNVSNAKKMLQGNIARQKNLKETSAEFIRLKKQQAVTLMRIDLAEVLSKKVASFQKLANRYKQKHFKDEAKYIDADSYELIQAILNEFGFNCHGISDNTKTIEQRFDEWYEQIAPYNKKGVYDFIGKIYASLYGHDTNFKNITLEQFDALNNLIRAIDDTAKKIQADKNEVKSEEFKGIVASIKERFDFYNVKEEIAFQNKKLNYVVVMPILLRKVLGDDLYVKHFAPFTSALTKAENWRIDKMKKFAEILKDELPRFSDQLAFDVLGEQRYFTRETALMMMLNSGNRHNRACMEKYLARVLDISEDTEISMEDVFSSILSQMPDEFQDYTQAIWDEIDSSREQFFNSQKEAYGINPTIVEKDQLDFVGSRLKGGYFPSYRSKLKETNDYMETQAYYDKSSFPIATSAYEKIDVHGDLDLSVKILSNWTRFTGNSIFISKPYNDVAKILNNNEIKDSLGANGSKHVSNWLEKANTEEAVFEGMAVLDKIANVQILGLTPVKGFKQLSGLAYSINEVGAMNIAGSMLDYFSNKDALNTIKYAMSLSDYMRSRYENAKDHLFAGFSEDALKGNKIKKTLDVANEYGLFFQKYFDAFASSVTWKAVYTREIANGKSEKDAVLLADTIVAQTQGDASKAMRPQALTGANRLFSKFSTFYISLFNSILADWTTIKDPKSQAHLAGTVFVTLVGGALFTSLVDSIVGKVFDDDDDKDFDEIFKEEIVRSTASAVVPIWGFSNLVSSPILYGKVYPNELTFLKPLVNIARDLNKGDVVGATTELLPIPKWISDYIKGED